VWRGLNVFGPNTNFPSHVAVKIATLNSSVDLIRNRTLRT
jgi:hypothetical protein